MSGNSDINDNSFLIITSGHRYLLIVVTAVVVSALFIGPITLLHLYDPIGPWSWLTAVIIFITVESAIVGWWLSSSRPRISHGWYRISEIVVLFVMLRLVFWAIDGGLPVLDRLQQIIFSPFLIFDLRFLIGFVLVLLAWDVSSRFSGGLAELTLTQIEVDYYLTPKDSRELTKFDIAPKYRDAIAREYVQRWLIGGAFLIIFTVITTFDLNGSGTSAFNIRTIGRLGIPEEMLSALLVYFIGGLWLIGQTRHQLLQARWLTNGTLMESTFGKTWSRWTILLLLTISIAAATLPIGSTFAISRLLQLLFGMIITAINFVLFIFSYLTFLLLSLFGSEQASQEFESVDIISQAPITESLPPPTSFVSVLTTGVFWLLAIAAITLSVFFVLSNRRLWIDLRPFNQSISSILSWLRGLFSAIGKRSTVLASALEKVRAVSVKRASVEPPWRFLRLSALSPREQVRYYYLSIVDRAARKGVKRMPPDTPLEYSESFESAWPEEESSMDQLTEGFIKSRYDQKEFSTDELRLIKDAFKDIRSALRANKVEKADDEEDPNDEQVEELL